jgi:hypothetical protein
MYVPTAVQISFARRVAAPTLVILTRDGVAGPILKMRSVARLGGIGSRGFSLAASAALGIANLSLVAAPPLLASIGFGAAAARLSSGLRRAAFQSELAAALSYRIGAIRRRSVVTLENGGHHPHMAQGGGGVAQVIARWAGGTAAANGKGQ